jgi:hypothetical protein
MGHLTSVSGLIKRFPDGPGASPTEVLFSGEHSRAIGGILDPARPMKPDVISSLVDGNRRSTKRTKAFA